MSSGVLAAPTENVWTAWNHMVKYGPDRTLQSQGHKRVHGIEDLTLSELLDLLAWVCDNAAPKHPPKWSFEKTREGTKVHVWTWTRHGHVTGYILGVSATTFKDNTHGRVDIQNLDSDLEAVLRAIDAIVEKHPEALQ